MYSYDGNIAFSADFTKHNNQKNLANLLKT